MTVCSSSGPESLYQFPRDGRQPGPQLRLRQPELAARCTYRSDSIPMRIRLARPGTRPTAVHDQRSSYRAGLVGGYTTATIPRGKQLTADTEITARWRTIAERNAFFSHQLRRVPSNHGRTGTGRNGSCRRLGRRNATKNTASGGNLGATQTRTTLRTASGEKQQIQFISTWGCIVELQRTILANVRASATRIPLRVASTLRLVEHGRATLQAALLCTLRCGHGVLVDRLRTRLRRRGRRRKDDGRGCTLGRQRIEGLVGTLQYGCEVAGDNTLNRLVQPRLGNIENLNLTGCRAKGAKLDRIDPVRRSLAIGKSRARGAGVPRNAPQGRPHSAGQAAGSDPRRHRA